MIETDSGNTIILVDSADRTEIYKSVDKGDNYTQPAGWSRSRTIYIDDNLTINGPASYKDETVYLNGNLTIESNGVLKLDNSILIVNRSALTHFVFKIFVHSGGRLEVTNNSVIKNNIFQSNNYEFEFAVDSEGH